MRLRRSMPTALAVLATLAAFVTLPTPAAFADSTTDTYIVQLKPGVSADAVIPKLMGTDAEVLDKVGAGVADITSAKAAALASSPYVKSVTKDAVVKASDTQLQAPWDLDKLDSRTASTDGNYVYPNNGSGVTVYVVDSGIIRTHSEFASVNILAGINYVPNFVKTVTYQCGQVEDPTVDPANTTDQAGHGTAVASLIAGATVGVAKGVTIVPVRVLDCAGGGTSSDIVTAINWILKNHQADTPAVVNFSLGGTGLGLGTVDSAVQTLIDNGLTVVAAAGNDNTDACNTAPAQVPGAITVAATTKSNSEATWTNYGKCVDLYAPGENDWVAWIGTSNNVIVQKSGTSFSAPLTTAAAAQVLHDHPAWTPAQVAVDISARASYGMITGARSANKLLNVGALGVYATSSVTIDSTGFGGDTAKAVLNWSPTPAAVTYVWARNGTPIAGATGQTYKLTRDDVDQSITVTATASGGGYSTTSATSSAIVAQLVLSITPGAPTIAGGAAMAYDAFVKASYQDFLGRQPSPSEVSFQSNALSSGTVSKAAYLASLSTSNEWLSAIVTKMYADTLNRTPDAGGLANWVSWLRSGRFTVAQAASLFYSSNEYFTVSAHSDKSVWVTLLYQKLLNRTADPSGLQFWIDKTNRYGMDWVAYNFYQSSETRMRRVEAIYQTLLFREPDVVGWPFWTARVLWTGDLTLAWEVANSDEYWTKAHTRY